MFLSYWLVDVLTLRGCDKSSRLRALVRSCIVTSETGSGDGDEDSPEDQEFVCKSKTFASQGGQLLSWKETFVLAPSLSLPSRYHVVKCACRALMSGELKG